MEQQLVTFGDMIRRLTGADSDDQRPIKGVSALGRPKPETVTFVREWGSQIGHEIERNPRTLFIVPTGSQTALPTNAVAHHNPRLGYAEVVKAFLVAQEEGCIASTAIVPTSCALGENVRIGHFSVLGEDVNIGANTIIDSHVTIKSGVSIGENCRVSSHTSIGGSGFGYEFDSDGIPILIPHLGGVRIGNNVEIGSNVSIAAGTIDPTELRDGVKVDDCAFIAHNVFIDEASYIIAGAEISGSVRIGKRVWVSPEVTIINKVSIGDDALLGIGSVVTKDVQANTVVAGVPARTVKLRYAVED